MTKRYQNALDDFKKVIELKPTHGQAHYYRAFVYDALGQTELAEADRRKSQELGYEQPDVENQ